MPSHIVTHAGTATPAQREHRLRTLDEIVLSSAATCRASDPDDWFPLTEDETVLRDIARKLCGDCPIQASCLERQLLIEEGMPLYETDGITAATTPLERYEIRTGVAGIEVAA
ncbi:WhiB family transcriptional regulator [Planotetraspora phitsanulokensis]|uniref:4Fe-4S Wbl-type domain-containing protein n=1 Tax=Planotetraspora phitsanulokensis TaxID=575192 RepID=A0A8J3XJ00_9ACTN|nr:WhiB family transcriptional regulator [Planotetraspora phitsanulokensis]GII42904.1 hypothetical protein Pph01_79070 [Planotetraspora phitsanulokensis]